MGKVYKTMQGKEVDMEKLMSQNELMPAIGNAKVNARGDELGPGGKIIKKREDIIAEYYESNPNAKPERAEPVRTKQVEIPPVGIGTNSKRTPKVQDEN